MALGNYGVLLGQKSRYYRDAPNAFGKFFHGHIDVQTRGQLYNTAIDVDTERAGVQVQWRIVHLRVPEWSDIFALADGYHALASTNMSGAVDYYRDSRLNSYFVLPDYEFIPVPWWKRPWVAWQHAWEMLTRGELIASISARAVDLPVIAAGNIRQTVMDRVRHPRPMPMPMPQPTTFSARLRVIKMPMAWKVGTDLQALSDLEAMIVDAARVVIFGAFYPASGARPPGLHDIHQNQGDPLTSPWASANGIWQDGLTIAIHSDGTASAFMNKFSTQSERTDDQGRPL